MCGPREKICYGRVVTDLACATSVANYKFKEKFRKTPASEVASVDQICPNSQQMTRDLSHGVTQVSVTQA